MKFHFKDHFFSWKCQNFFEILRIALKGRAPIDNKEKLECLKEFREVTGSSQLKCALFLDESA